jgi:DNA-binding XRE family transcriptional regulator
LEVTGAERRHLMKGRAPVSGKPGTYPNRVRELREDRLMTQAQLARKAKVALRTIHSVEKGMNCRMDTKRKILLALSMRFEDKDQVFPSGLRRSSFGEPAPVSQPTQPPFPDRDPSLN